MFKIEVDEKLLAQAVKIALNTDILPIEEYPGHGVQLTDYLEFVDGPSAVELGVYLSEVDAEGKPKRHWHSDLRQDEQEDIEVAILTPLIKAAIEHYLKKLAEVAV